MRHVGEIKHRICFILLIEGVLMLGCNVKGKYKKFISKLLLLENRGVSWSMEVND